MKKIISIFSAIILLLLTINANAQLKKFYTTEMHYGCPSPADEFYFTWDEATGKVVDYYWKHEGTVSFLHTLPSKVVRDEKTLYDYDVYLNVTIKGFESTAYQIRGKLTLTAMRPDGAVFGGVYEGTGVYPMMANGVYVKK